MFHLNFCVFVKIQTKNKLIPEFNNTFMVRGARLAYRLRMGISKCRKIHITFVLLTRKTTAEAVVHSLRWGAIRESDPFMSGSQPDVLTVSPIAPRLRYDRCVAGYSQGKNS